MTLTRDDSPQQPSLRRTLRFRDLILYGIILIQPTAPMPSYGVISAEAHGHVVTAIFLAMIAMLFTSISYGRMARIYPRGGSAFLYVGKQIHPGAGYLTGWCMMMDYIINPLICTIWCSQAAMNFVPQIPYVVYVCLFATLFTTLNCNGVETSAKINAGVAAALGVVILLVAAAAIKYLLHLQSYPAGFLTHPFFDRSTFTPSGLLRGTSIAVLTYIGFDGISTLSDEAKDPSRTIPRAIVWTCIVTGILAGVEVYLGQLVWPQSLRFPEIDTAYVYISGRVGGPALFSIVNGALLLATIGSGMASQLGAARLMLAMGQDGALPRKFFGAIHPKNQIPRNNVILIGGICLLGALWMNYGLGAELLNFGALLAFMGVNLAALTQAWREGGFRLWFPMLLAVCGFVTCFVIWLGLGRMAWIVGSIWAGVGIVLWFLRRNLTHLPGDEAL